MTAPAGFEKRHRLLQYFENELQTLRRLSDDFARYHQDEAERLKLKDGRCDDPHVERLIESVALLTARVQMRLDDDFPQVCETLLDLVLPEFQAPIPSLGIVQVGLGSKLRPSAVVVPRHTQLLTRPIGDTRCRFRTCYPVELWPCQVTQVEFVATEILPPALRTSARSALRIVLQAQGGLPFAAMPIERLQFHLDGEWSFVSRLYDLLLQGPCGLAVRIDAQAPAMPWPKANIRALGFEADESLLGIRRRSTAGHRLLLEHFAFPEKFMFVGLEGLGGMTRGARQMIELFVLLDQPVDVVQGIRIGPDNLRLGCTPIENLFSLRPDPIVLDETQPDFEVVPDVRARDHYEVYEIQGVSARLHGRATEVALPPFYGKRQGGAPASGPAFWHARRRAPLSQGAPGSASGHEEMRIAIVDQDYYPVVPDGLEVLMVDALCTNGDLPAGDGLQWGRTDDLEIVGQPDVVAVRCLKRPTAPLRRPLGRDTRWQLVSTLALNHLSLDGSDSADPQQAQRAMQQILAMFDCRRTDATQRRRESLTGVRARRVSRLVGDSGLMRGLAVTLQFDPQKLQGTSLLLFGTVLECFLSMQATVNSFIQCEAVLGDEPEPRQVWPARLGGKRIL